MGLSPSETLQNYPTSVPPPRSYTHACLHLITLIAEPGVRFLESPRDAAELSITSPSMLHTTAGCSVFPHGPTGPCPQCSACWNLVISEPSTPYYRARLPASLRLSSAPDDQLDILWIEVTPSDMGPAGSLWADSLQPLRLVRLHPSEANPNPQQAAGIHG